MMAELAESEPAYSLLPWTNNSQFSRDYVITFDFMKGNFWNLGIPSSEWHPVNGWKT